MTPAEHQELILAEVGDDPTAPVVAPLLPTLWTIGGLWAAARTSDVAFQELLQHQYALVFACNVVLGANVYEVTFSEKDRREDLDQLSKHPQQIRANALTLIEDTLLTLTNPASAGIEVGVLTATVPVPSPSGYPDMADSYFRGYPQPGYPRVAR